MKAFQKKISLIGVASLLVATASLLRAADATDAAGTPPAVESTPPPPTTTTPPPVETTPKRKPKPPVHHKKHTPSSSGRVVTFDAATGALAIAHGDKIRTVTVDQTTRITKDGAAATKAAIRPGELVSVTVKDTIATAVKIKTEGDKAK